MMVSVVDEDRVGIRVSMDWLFGGVSAGVSGEEGA
jgi:hypothetical protein